MNSGDPGSFPITARFESMAFLGSGSIGSVYRAYDREMESVVALKTLRDPSPEQVYRLKSEFRSLAGVVHPNLVQLYELSVNEVACFFSMEIVDGYDFVEWIRQGDGTLRIDRFIVAARQLLQGLGAVHAAGRLHRDVKPPNVRVNLAGEVKLLDFDLAVPMRRGAREGDNELAGTFAYMAPEQAWGRPIAAAADLYATGVVFYEALAGRLPFAGSPTSIPQRQASAPTLRRISGDVPEWLETLILELLHRSPDERPSLEEALRRLGAEDSQHPDIRVTWLRAHESPFVGRKAGFETLHRAFAAMRSGVTSIVRAHGSSGIGKTELVQHFLARIDRDASPLILRGRCHPQESVPYKAVDAIVDALSRALLELDEAAARALVPDHGDALVRLFPVLSEVPGLTPRRRDAAWEADADSARIRSQGFGALRTLFARLGASRPLVLWIDDLQWSDADSAALLREILRPPAPPPLLLLLSYRSEDRADIELVAMLDELVRGWDQPRLHDVEILPLASSEAEELAARLCPQGRGNGETLSLLLSESSGSPFLIGELARHLATQAAADLRHFDLAEVIRRRLSSLAPEARRIVELVAVAAAPIERNVLLQAAERGEAGRPIVSMLESECMTRMTIVGEVPAVQAYHDRIREVVVSQLSEGERARRHRDLAGALESRGQAEPERLAHHFHGAGLLPRAADYALAAADRAAATLAFVRAAQLYRSAREWDPRDAAWRRTLQAREGDVLANAAHFVPAARLFETASREGASPREALELQRRAAEQLLAGGHMDEGVRVLSGVLRHLGLRYPRSPGTAIAGAVGQLLRLAAGRVTLPRGDTRVDEEAALRADTCHAAGRVLVDADAIRGVYFNVQALRHARRAGDPLRLGRSLILVGGAVQVIGGRAMRGVGERMMRQGEALAERLGSTLLRGSLSVQRSQVLMLAGRWREALQQANQGVALLERSPGAAFERFIGLATAQRAVEELGDIDALERQSRESLQMSMAVGDRFSEVAASQHLAFALTARDELAAARTLSRVGMDLWSRQGFHLQHLYSLRQDAYCELYDGDAAAALARLEAMWPQLEASHLLRVPLVRVDVRGLRGRLALAAAHRNPARAPQLARVCDKDVRALAREGRDDAAVHACLLAAGLARLRAQHDEALHHLERGLALADAVGMELHGATALHRRAELTSDAVQRRAAADRMRARGVRMPSRWADVYLPWGAGQAPGAA